MFSDKQAATAFLSAYCANHDLNPKIYMDVLVESLVPAIGFTSGATDKKQDRRGSYFGGLPVLPMGTDWPIRQRVSDLDALAKKGGSNHAAHLKRYGGQDFPYEFMAQIECASVAASDVAPNAFPRTGWLSFFYDSTIGPWRNGMQTCRVIWDNTESSNCRELTQPSTFTEMEALEKTELLNGENIYGLSQEQLLDCLPTFVHPTQPVKPEAILKILDRSTIDYRKESKLYSLIEGDEDFEYMYDDLIYEGGDTYLQHQMFGSPSPEQDDPRYDSAHIHSGLRNYKEAGDEWPSIFAQLKKLAADWHLLLQVCLNDLTQNSLVEGTVYFLIHKDDLAAHDFANVIAIYQQT